MNHELKDRLNGCIAVEYAVAAVYNSFMKIFPDERNFWEGLHNDEVAHSAFLINALNLYDSAHLPPEMHPPALPYVVKTLEFANNINYKIRLNPISLKEALKMALELEETMVETFVNDLMGSLLNDNKILSGSDIEKVIAAEKEHASRIRNMMFRKGFLRSS